MGIIQDQGTIELTIPQGQKIDIYCENGTAILHYSTFPVSPELYYEVARVTNNSQLFGTFTADRKIRLEAKGDAVLYDVAVNPSVRNLQGWAWKEPVRVATTTNGALATAFADGQTVDGVTIATGDRILLKDQTDQTENGIYVVRAAGAPARSDDGDQGDKLVSCAVRVETGTANDNKSFVCTNDSVILGTTNIVFVNSSTLISHNTTTGLQGGTTNEYYHITATVEGHINTLDQSLASTDAVTFAGITSTGVVNVTNNSQSTSATTGAIYTAGGIGLAKDLFVGGVVKNSDGTVALPSYTFSGDTDTGMYRNAGNGIGFTTAGVEKLSLDQNGNIICGTAALATTATDGFLYIPTCAGAPTGTPTSKTGRVPLIFDTTGNSLYIYDGTWVSVGLI